MAKELTVAEIEHLIFVGRFGNVKNVEMIEEYARRQIIKFIENISRNPISCYSVKPHGGEKQFFLGKDYVEKLISSIKKQ